MRLFSFDPNEPGVFAVGQIAFGVFALGQAAAGVVAVGQGAVGLVALGQGGIGVYWGGGMLGVGARGFPIGLAPRYPVPTQLPTTTDLSQVTAGYGDGWVEAELGRANSGTPTLFMGSMPAGIRLRAGLVQAAEYELTKHGQARVVAHVRRIGEHLVCDRLFHVHVSPMEKPDFWRTLAIRTGLLTVIAVPIVQFILLPLWSA